MNLIELKNKENFSLWLDYLSREFIEKELRDYIELGISGVTTNPAIFYEAFKTPFYKDLIIKAKEAAKKSGKKIKPYEIYENIVVEDIKLAGKMLEPVHKASNGRDGFVSIEVNPAYCSNAEKTIEEARRLYEAISLPNVMIKIPATFAGYKAMDVLSNEGININATLIFSKAQAKKVAATISNSVHSVLSVFVSRLDSYALKEGLSEMESFMLGIYNATCVYNNVHQNANKRVLFASTGTKSEKLEPTYYIDKLLFKNTINTAPLKTCDAFLERGDAHILNPTLNYTLISYFKGIEPKIDVELMQGILLEQGLEAFKDSFKAIERLIEETKV